MSDPGIYGLGLLVIPLGAGPIRWLIGNVNVRLRNFLTQVLTLGLFGFSLSLFPAVQSGNLSF
ncbi:MAG: hypothetical protein ABEI54_00160, partial [Candidatus Bipolaricaulia bacterium]